jgi:ubiquitin carboxyl-terminal hydrolase 4/11
MEIFNNRFYKNLDDNVMCNEMGDSDIIACYELPCHSQQTRSYKRQEGDPFILSVVLTESRPIQRYGNSNTQYFGYPFFIAVTSEQATSLDSIYDLIVERLQKWTTNVRDLHSWEAGPASSSMEEVPIPLVPNSMVETVTEIKENGDVVTIQEPVVEEGDITDEKAVVDEEQDGELKAPHDDTPRRVGYKKDLFNMRIQPGNTQYGAGYTTSMTRVESWERRMERLKEEGTQILLQEHDSVLCEFDETLRAYYFGDKPSFELARWKTWEKFVHPELTASREAASHQKKRGITLQDCLDEFTKEEQLGEDDLWYCPSCKKHQQATKRFDIWNVPDILVVHLKRFSNNRTLRDKIDTLVDFPLEGLDLTSMVGERQVAKRLAEKGEDILSLGLTDVDEPLVYDLYAVDEHLGGLGGGHYRAYAYNDPDSQWYHFDDSYVSTTQASSSIVSELRWLDSLYSANQAITQNSNAYLLFYKRRTSRPLGGKTHDKVKAAKGQAETPDLSGAEFTLDPEDRPVSQLPTPPADSERQHNPDAINLSWRSQPQTWVVPSSRARSSPSSSSGVSDDVNPPAFEDALDDPIIHTSYDTLAAEGSDYRPFSFPDPTSNGSPSSVNADFDPEELDTDASDDVPLKYPTTFTVQMADDEMSDLESVGASGTKLVRLDSQSSKRENTDGDEVLSDMDLV